MTEQIEKEEPSVQAIDEKLVGISGWLILPAIWFVLGSIIGVVALVANIGIYSAGFGGIYAFELIVLSGLIGFQIYAAILFFKKKRNAPRIIITLYIVNIVASCVLLIFKLGAGTEMFAVETGKQFVRDVIGPTIGAAIWIPYFRVSKRVKATFVN